MLKMEIRIYPGCLWQLTVKSNQKKRLAVRDNYDN